MSSRSIKFLDANQLKKMISKTPRRVLKPLNPSKRASVLIPIFQRDGKAHLLLTRRSHTVGSHKGQISFPGGRADGNETPIETGIIISTRECIVN
jgi:hypothetical protein